MIQAEKLKKYCCRVCLSQTYRENVLRHLSISLTKLLNDVSVRIRLNNGVVLTESVRSMSLLQNFIKINS